MSSRYQFAQDKLVHNADNIQSFAQTITDTAYGVYTMVGDSFAMNATTGMTLNAATIAQTATGVYTITGDTLDMNASAGATLDAVTITQAATGAYTAVGASITNTTTGAFVLNSATADINSTAAMTIDAGTTLAVTAQDANSFTFLGNRILTSVDKLDTAAYLDTSATNGGAPLAPSTPTDLTWNAVPANTFVTIAGASITLDRIGVYTFDLQLTSATQARWNILHKVNAGPVNAAQWHTPTPALAQPLANVLSFKTAKTSGAAVVVTFSIEGVEDAPAATLGMTTNLHILCQEGAF